MKYIALLRGINVGGKNIIKMVALKACLEKAGFEEVTTYIQSGNVIFNAPAGGEKNTKKLEKMLEKALSKEFNYVSKVLVRSYPQIKKVLENVPTDWKERKDIRCYVAFVKEPTTPREVVEAIPAKEGVDFLKTGKGVVYMATLLSGITKSGINKIIGKEIYQNITIRNYNTTKKIATLMA